jgi:hypothetical protein
MDEQLSLGREPSWNNPDFIQDILALSYDPQRPQISTTFQIHNRSPEVAAVGVLVSVSFSRFGIGLERRPLGNIIVGLGPGRGEYLDLPYPQMLLAELGHLPALFIQIHHSLDQKLINNYGEHAEQVQRTSEVGRAFSLRFPVRNDAQVARQINIGVLTTDLGTNLSLNNRLFAPFEQVDVDLNVVVPATITGSINDPFPPQRTLTVMAHDAGSQLIGGVSYIIRIDS